jgi:ribose transport system substrate-binding protein
MANDGPWRIAETNNFKESAQKYGVTLITTDANNSDSQQVTDCLDMIAQGVDFLCMAPHQADGFSDVFAAAKKANVPLLMIDREAKGTAGSDYVTYITSDTLLQGKEAGKWLVKNSGGNAQIIEITGTPGVIGSIERGDGFRAVISDNPGMKIIAQQTGNFQRAAAQSAMTNIIQSTGGKFNAVYCHNDDMNIGVIQALEAAGIDTAKILSVGVDGSKDAIQAIVDGKLGATVWNGPMYAPTAFAVMAMLKQGKSVETKYILPSEIIDKSNVQEYVPLAF